MSNNIYEQNYDLLYDKCEWIYDDLKENKCCSQDIYEYETAQGTVGLYLDFQEKGIVQLGSQYDPKGYAATWRAAAMRDNPFENNAYIFVFGLGTGEYIKELLKYTTEENVIFIYEPSLEILNKILQVIDLKEILNKDNVILLSSGDNGKLVFEATIKKYFSLSNVCSLRLYELPNYGNLFEDEYVYVTSQLHQTIWKVGATVRTQNVYAVKFAQNQLESMESVLRSASFEKLLEQLPKGFPGIVIAAGPSLRKNMEELKRAKGKAFLIATDSSLRALLENGIIPDLHITVDYNKGDFVFQHPGTWDIPLAVCTDSKSEIIPRARNKVFLFDVRKTSLPQKALSMIGKEHEIRQLFACGSVAHTALSVLLEAKMDPIIFVGQDLAYPDGKLHVEGVFAENSVDKNKSYKLVEDVNGNQVMSDQMMCVFREWIEFVIKTTENVRFIDATEGGAKIIGAEIKTLKEVVDAECTKAFNYEALIANMPDLLTEQEKKDYYHVIVGLEEELDKEREKAQQLVDCYETLDQESKSENADKANMERQMETIAELTTYFDEEALLYPLIESFTAQIRNKVTLQLSKKKEAINEELQHVIENGLEMAHSIVFGTEQLKPMVREFIQKMQQNHKELEQ